ncbi:MAG: hypothetical protein HY074_17370, partial [Deltaproteobacteria bacterium]|nr:hypothetical protein [Deltaproteobacteria bacterium]
MADEKNTKEAKAPGEKKPAGEKKPPGEKKAGGKKKAAGTGISFAVEMGRPRGPTKTPRMRKLYEEKVIPALLKELGLK